MSLASFRCSRALSVLAGESVCSGLPVPVPVPALAVLAGVSGRLLTSKYPPADTADSREMRSVAPSKPVIPGRWPACPSLIATVDMADIGVPGPESPSSHMSGGVDGRFRIVGCDERDVDGVLLLVGGSVDAVLLPLPVLIEGDIFRVVCLFCMGGWWVVGGGWL